MKVCRYWIFYRPKSPHPHFKEGWTKCAAPYSTFLGAIDGDMASMRSQYPVLEIRYEQIIETDWNAELKTLKRSS